MLTGAQVREQLGISRETLRRLIKSGQLSAIKAGTGPNAHLRISEEDLADFIERSRVQPAVNQ